MMKSASGHSGSAAYLLIAGENRVAVLDVIELAENRLCRPTNTVLVEPL